MGIQPFVKFLGSLILFWGSVGMAHADRPNPLTVDFPTPIHFLTPGGEDVVIPAGMYQVEVAEAWLKLIPDGERRLEAILVDATSGTHEETLTESAVRLEGESENPDVFHLAMLLSDGTGLEAIGTQSGIRPRGWRSAFVSKLSNAKTFVSPQRAYVSRPGSQTQAQLRQPKIPLPGSGSQTLAPVSPVLKSIKSIHYRGNFPSHRKNGWSDALQGVANDDKHWFFTQVGRLWKFPISHDLNTKVYQPDSSKGILAVSIPKTLRDKGYNHFGDLDYFDGYVFIPLEGYQIEWRDLALHPKKIGVTPRIAVFRASTLSYVGSFLLPEQTHAGWCAIHPITKRLYSSNNHISSTNPLFVYAFDWGQLKTATASSILSWQASPQKEFLFDGQGQNKMTIKPYLQGGDFSAYGEELYIVNGKADKFTNTDGGIWVFSGNDHRLLKRSSQSGEFKFEFHPGWSKYEEPEGITIWDVPSGKAPRIPRSQAHVILLDNDADTDEWYFKHYEVIR
ncbi:MAG: hypothetical protein OEY57_00180 [Nitrospirota bacterium]|nr:hypothetical protein [Nitrospirota bacterium]